jgi:hypothetical protein
VYSSSSGDWAEMSVSSSYFNLSFPKQGTQN